LVRGNKKEGREDIVVFSDDPADYPNKPVEEYEWYTEASNEEGESELIAGRVDPKMARMIDESIIEAKAHGIPFKTRSDFLRFAVTRGLRDLMEYLGGHHEELTHYLVLKRQAMQSAHRSYMLKEPRDAVKRMWEGLSFLLQHGDYEEAKKRLDEFLQPIFSMAGQEDFLMKLWIREMFIFQPLSNAIKKIEEEAGLSASLENAKRAYERMS
jgi:hypothetical protein